MQMCGDLSPWYDLFSENFKVITFGKIARNLHIVFDQVIWFRFRQEKKHDKNVNYSLNMKCKNSQMFWSHFNATSAWILLKHSLKHKMPQLSY